MNFIPTVLVVTGSVILVVALILFRKPTGKMDHLAVHKKMDDVAIRLQLKHKPQRAEAGLCVFFGLCFIAVGVIWQSFVWYVWWGVGS
jgi:hypothetical protein